MEMLTDQHPFGRFLFRSAEDNASIVLITKPAPQIEWKYFDNLENNMIACYFYETLHAKLYLFEIDESKISRFDKASSSLALVGSANLTNQGFGLRDEQCNEELCYQLPKAKFTEAKRYAEWLRFGAEDLIQCKYRLSKQMG
jgi:hypothetical protein